MKLGTRSRIAIATAVLATAPLLGAAAPAGAAYPICQEDHCDVLIQYYSDASKTVRVGEYGTEVCGYVNWGEMTSYSTTIRRYC